MNKQRIVSLFALLLAPVAYSQTWSKLATEGATAATSPIVTVKAGQTYRFGSGTKWCSSVTPTVDTKVTVWFAAMGCSDPAQGVQKELDVLVPPIVIPPAQPQIAIPKLLGTFTCTVQMYDDMTFTANSKQCTPVTP